MGARAASAPARRVGRTGRAAGHGWAAPRAIALGLVCVLAVAVASWPVWDLQPPVTFDVDWAAALAYAAEHRLHFGEQVAFTYGPLGFLVIPIGPLLFYDGITRLEWLFAAVLQLALAGTLLLALRRRFPLGVAVVASVVVLALVQDRALALGFALWALWLARDPAAARGRLVAAAPIALGVLTGTMLLGKLNQGVELALLALVALPVVAGRRDRLAFAAALLGSAALGWLATGQTLADVWPYLRNGTEVIAGYPAAMGLERASYGWSYAVSLLLSAAALALAWDAGRGWSPWRRRALAALVLLFAAFDFKEGFVRQDEVHLQEYLGDLLIVFAVLPVRAALRPALLAGVVALVVAFGVAEGAGEVTRSLDVVANARAVASQVATLASPSRRAAMEQRLRANVVSQYALSPELLEAVGAHSVMLWPMLRTEVAYAYGLDLRPLPTLEPYSSYTPALDRLGARMLASPRGPERILRATEELPTIDGRFASFEAPLVTLGILCRYRQVAAAPPWQALAREPSRCGAARTLGTVGAPWGRPVAVPAPHRANALLLVRVHGADAAGLERLRALLLRPRSRWIALDGVRHRLVPATAADGLLLSTPAASDYPPPFALAPDPRTIAVGRAGGEPHGALRYTFVEMAIRPFAAARGG